MLLRRNKNSLISSSPGRSEAKAVGDPHRRSHRGLCELLFFLFAFCGCLRKPAVEPSAFVPTPTASNSSIQSYALFDPGAAEVKVTVAELSTSLFQEKYSVPSFALQRQGSDFVKILRCHETFRAELQARMSEATSATEEQRKWVWLDAFGDPKQCKVASQRFNGDSFQDIGAQNGQFFYVLNPCVSADLSTSGTEACSHLLVLSTTLSYSQSPAEAFLRKTAELSDAESAYDAIISRLLGLSRRIAQQKEACEYAVNHHASKDRVEALGWDVFSGVIAIGSGFAARGLLSKAAATTAVTNKLPMISTAAKTPGIYTAGFFGAAFALSKTLRVVLDKPTSSSDIGACRKADALAQQLLQIDREGELGKASEALIRISLELKAMDQSFEGYGDASFQ